MTAAIHQRHLMDTASVCLNCNVLIMGSFSKVDLLCLHQTPLRQSEYFRSANIDCDLHLRVTLWWPPNVERFQIFEKWRLF